MMGQFYITVKYPTVPLLSTFITTFTIETTTSNMDTKINKFITIHEMMTILQQNHPQQLKPQEFTMIEFMINVIDIIEGSNLIGQLQNHHLNNLEIVSHCNCLMNNK